MSLNAFISENKRAIVFTSVFMIIGTLAYFTFGPVNLAMNSSQKSLFEDAKFKIAFETDGSLNIFANVKNNKIVNIKAAQGNQIPEDDSIVVGYNQELNLKEQGKSSTVGNRAIEYFGINTTIEGILEKRDDIVDELTFLSPRQFEQINGEPDRVFSKKTSDGEEKLFFRLPINQTNLTFQLAEGSVSGYSNHDLDGKTYYPIIIGAKEAKMMQNKKIFANTGDPIRNFFGHDFVVSGILKETNTSIDRLHFVTFNSWDMKDE